MAVFLVLATSWLATGCVIKGEGSKISYGVNGALVVAGVGIVSGEKCRSESVAGGIACLGVDAFTEATGKAMIIGGITAAAVNLVVNHNVERPKVVSPQINFTVAVNPAPAHMGIALTAPGLVAVRKVSPPPEPARVKKPAPEECKPAFAEWKREKDNFKRYDLFRGMSQRCQKAFVAL